MTILSPTKTSQSIHNGRMILWVSLMLVSIVAWLVMPVNYSNLSAITQTQPIDLSQLPLAFVPNAGQTASPVLFQANGLDSTMFFTIDQVALVLPGINQMPLVLRIEFEASSAAGASGEQLLPGIASYFAGSDPQSWHTNIPTYAGIVYQQLYPGIDLHYTGKNGSLKGTYTIAPRADPGAIQWRHSGVANVRLDETSGNLVIRTTGASQTLVEQSPIAWQVIAGARIPVEVSYVQHADNSYGFAVGRYNPAYALVIDPTLLYATYLGGGSYEDAEGIAVDSGGNIYLTGTTNSIDFPTEAALYAGKQGWDDAYVLKLNAAGDSLLFSTYLGGSEDDAANAIGIDNAMNIYLVGNTTSADFPVQNAYQDECAVFFGGCTGDAFLARLSPDGAALDYSTYLGGSNPDSAEALAVTQDGKAYLAGTTFSSNFPTLAALQAALHGPSDAFVAIVDTALVGNASLVYSTFFGGSATDDGFGIALGSSIYLAGTTTSTNLPTFTPFQAAIGGSSDAFFARMSADGQALEYGTYLGGSGADVCYDLAIDSAGRAYLVGSTESANFPTQDPLQSNLQGSSDAFVARFNPGGSTLEYSTYLGGGSYDYGYAIAVDGIGQAYLTGSTHSTNFPLQDHLQYYAGNGDAFAARLAADGGSLLYSTYLGGDESDTGTAITLDGLGHAYITGLTFSANFPTQDPLQAAYAGGGDVFIAKLHDDSSTPPPPPPPTANLSGSSKSASQPVLSPGQTLTYTIQLINSGGADASIQVTDPVPVELAYIAGSATGGGVYDSATATLAWSSINVPAGTSTDLTFQVEPAIQVSKATAITNTATISSSGTSLERHAWIALAPQAINEPILTGSIKYPSQLALAPGQKLAYTIQLINSGTVSASVDVTDPVPGELAYIDGSVKGGGVYDPVAAAITWSGIEVPPGSTTALSFEVEPALTVVAPTVVTNTAIISASGSSFERHAWIALVPELLEEDTARPVINSLVIGEQDVLYSPEVTLHISATDNVKVSWMYLAELEVVTAPVPHWSLVQTSGWVPFQQDYAWTLGEHNGPHFIGAWVADDALNLSLFDRGAIDFASLIQPDDTASLGELIPYLVYYPEGVDVHAVVTPTVGNVDLLVWYPNNFLLPDQFSLKPGPAVDEVQFTTPETGVYIFLLYGQSETNHTLTITPGGGPAAWTSVRASAPASAPASPFVNQTATTPVLQAGLINEPIFSLIGLDPLGFAAELQPEGPYVIHMPLIIH